MNPRSLVASKHSYAGARAIGHGARLATIFALMSLLAACATGPYSYNEGSVNVVRLKNQQPATRTEPKPATSIGLYLAVTDDADSVIKKHDAFSVRLLSAFICDFRELSNTTDLFAHGNVGGENGHCQGGDGSQHPGTRGEIAIVASVGERRANAGLTFDPASVRNGRLIYYNEDVRETGQLINATNLPVYGPKTYEGMPFYMDWSVLELDNKENAAARKLLQQLAEIGTLATAPYTPVVKLLNTLGSTLVDANNDDLELRFQLEMDPYFAGSTVVSRMALREGYYAFIRSENRSAPLNREMLESLSVCSDEGTLCDSNTRKTWRERTWLLVRVARETEDAALAQDTAQSLSGLMDALNASAASSGISDTTLKGVTSAIKEILDRQIAARPKK